MIFRWLGLAWLVEQVEQSTIPHHDVVPTCAAVSMLEGALNFITTPCSKHAPLINACFFEN